MKADPECQLCGGLGLFTYRQKDDLFECSILCDCMTDDARADTDPAPPHEEDERTT